MIFLFIIKLRVKIERNTIHDIPAYNQTSCKKVRNRIHGIPLWEKSYNSIFKPRVKKVRNKIHDIPVHNQT